MRRTLTVTLTDAQFRALAGAVALADADMEAQELPELNRQRRTLDRAWTALNRAWYAKERR